MQQDTALIESIIRQVLSRILELPVKSSVLVLASQKDVDPKLLAQHSLPGARVEYLDTVKADMGWKTPKAYDQVLVPTLSCADMVDLALGRASGTVAEVILSLLLHGQTVTVMEFEYHRFKDTASTSLWDLYESYEKTLAGYGVARITAVTGQTVVARKKLVTEQDMADIAAQGAKRLTVAAGAIVTSLAVDIARTHQIEIIRN